MMNIENIDNYLLQQVRRNGNPEDDSTNTDEGGRPPILETGNTSEMGSGSGAVDGIAPNIALQETRVMKRLRVVLVFVTVTCATLLCTGTYLFVSRVTSKNYELSYEKLADSIEGSVATNIKNLESGLKNLGDAIASYATSTSSPEDTLATGRFPFVRVDNFETHGYHARDRSNMEAIVFAPIITAEQVEQWEKYSFAEQGWIQESRKIFSDHLPAGKEAPVYIAGDISSYIYQRRDNIFAERRVDPYDSGNHNETFMPAWYMSPPPMNPAFVNLDVLSRPEYYSLIERALKKQSSVLSPFVDSIEAMLSMQVSDADHLRYHQEINQLDVKAKNTSVGYDQPHSLYAQPVYEGPGSSKIIGVLLGVAYLATLLPDGVNGVFCVVRSECNGIARGFTYELNSDRPIFRGEGINYHPAEYEHMKRQVPFFAVGGGSLSDDDNRDDCTFHLEIYPSLDFISSYDSPVNIIATATVIAFAIVALSFHIYDFVVNARNRKVEETAARSEAVVSSLFPEHVRDRVMMGKKKRIERPWWTTNDPSSSDGESDDGDRVIADFYPAATILFADIVGFTAWSSTREPKHVFILLETLFSSFDKLARRRKVFKVETVGDCYVAVCGVPTPRANHAVVMARFADGLINRANRLFKNLIPTLGPDTGTLALRVGVHSGPVIAGVLRGDNARFQLFGDTMNTTSRVESTGLTNKIHISQETANLLVAAGKECWVTKRETLIVAKGKGELQTYWVSISGKEDSEDKSTSASSQYSSSIDDDTKEATTQINRCIQWNCSILLSKLGDVIEQRNEGLSDELKTVIADEVNHQVGAYVRAIAVRYHDNMFHNFEHATHVAMSVVKLLSRIATQDGRTESKYAYAIAKDSIMQLAAIFSALIHDVDHLGIPNTRLSQEQPALAAKFGNQSVAEKNSIDIAWNLLLQPKFNAFRKCIAPSDEDLAKFRKIVVHATLATDIMDKDLKADRNLRWAKAFSSEGHTCGNSDELKVRIVIEHLIQASDVCHTMQHWHIYRKWNELLFREMYKAWKDGRANKNPKFVNTTNPAQFWYEGEIGFFQHYIIPLTEKLADCGVFGVSCDEYLNYATENAARWEREGLEIVESMVTVCEDDFDNEGSGGGE